MANLTWAIITGEYPPQEGGVSDYTRLVARGLAAAGDEVHVWAPACASPTLSEPGVRVRRLPDHYGLRSLSVLDTDLDCLRRPFRLLIQYEPYSFGCRAMNLPFGLWLLSRRQDTLWLMYHEVARSCGGKQPLKHRLVGAATWVLALMAARAGERHFVTIPAWRNLLAPLMPADQTVQWLPVPCTLPTEVDPAVVASTRAALGAGHDTALLGHFGTFGQQTASLLRLILPPLLLADDRRIGLLVGRGGRQFAADLVRHEPALHNQLVATGSLISSEAAAHLAACDLLLQPYPDGVSTRRTSLMAGLALGRPIVTSEGPLSESLWRESQAVALAQDCSTRAMVDVAEDLLADGGRRLALAAAAKVLYDSRFSLEHTIRALRL